MSPALVQPVSASSSESHDQTKMSPTAPPPQTACSGLECNHTRACAHRGTQQKQCDVSSERGGGLTYRLSHASPHEAVHHAGGRGRMQAGASGRSICTHKARGGSGGAAQAIAWAFAAQAFAWACAAQAFAWACAAQAFAWACAAAVAQHVLTWPKVAAVAQGAALLRVPADPWHRAGVVAAGGRDLGLCAAGHAVLALATRALVGHRQRAGPACARACMRARPAHTLQASSEHMHAGACCRTAPRAHQCVNTQQRAPLAAHLDTVQYTA